MFLNLFVFGIFIVLIFCLIALVAIDDKLNDIKELFKKKP